ncbi:putative O-glycosylation ligase, exosortase A system-associated [Pseudoduganella sp. LjRoot289]|uniref:putative O-glycosylation ligase, exosortase A system-associated n=1 Tax=Pseudoduganella sp. LjRoot289 TaxID=3342314 RepID=UPI003ECC5DD5
MRDILITLIVFASLPYTFKKPYIGVLMWVWISVMNPHRLSWGFAYSFPFAAIVAGVTLLALVLVKGPRKLPATPAVKVMIAFTLWMTVTTLFAIHPSDSYEMMMRVMKIMLMTFVAMMLIRDKEQIHFFLWTLVGSLGYYGVKGGLFTAMTGGSFRVWGPDSSFIHGNNEVALALVVLVPIIYYLFMETANKWLKRGLLVSIPLCLLAAIGSYSRGALLALLAMSFFLWLKSPKKVVVGLAITLTIPLLVMFMPAQWGQRMDTINEYKEDASAMGRINAWWMAYNLAVDRPLTGGGFEIYDAGVFARYAPIPNDIHAAHSVYFQCLGEHGFIGLGLYLGTVMLCWRRANWIIRQTSAWAEFQWAGKLARMIQVSIIGFGVGGAFLSLLYFDVPYYLLAMLLVTGQLVQDQLQLRQQTGTAAKLLVPSAKRAAY